ncbi:hypothetical protein [Methanosarcina horonobensis]|uniref:hypothetical protein n=1 Tax=Methanosarcina horonobensis TaxID=418008 RepID=UPI000A7E185F|nr:hypothetical protein [Methanosarcina horonobensis]
MLKLRYAQLLLALPVQDIFHVTSYFPNQFLETSWKLETDLYPGILRFRDLKNQRILCC